MRARWAPAPLRRAACLAARSIRGRAALRWQYCVHRCNAGADCIARSFLRGFFSRSVSARAGSRASYRRSTSVTIPARVAGHGDADGRKILLHDYIARTWECCRTRYYFACLVSCNIVGEFHQRDDGVVRHGDVHGRPEVELAQLETGYNIKTESM